MISDVKMKHTHIPVRVHGISDGTYNFIYETDPREIELPEQFTQPVHVRVDMEKSGDQAYLMVAIDTSAAYPCDRCLEDLTVPIRAGFRLLYVRSEETAQVTPEGEEPRNVDPAEPMIDIASDVVDVTLVNIPMRKVCEVYNPANTACEQQVEERTHDNAAPGDDPRWAALKNLKLDD
jgi:uncharacterized metal-binding protein YceD (DUF177 family)